jgi:hypothetical protein
VKSCINVQHNYDEGGCPVKKTRPSRIERRETGIMTPQVEHTDENHFVINTASFHAPFQHHKISGTTLPEIQDIEMD